VRHGQNDLLRDFLVELCDAQSLLGSATMEHGVGGDLRTSLCSVQRSSTRFSLVKRAPVISYGVHADAILVTARRSPESAPGDQVLVLCRPPDLTLEQVSEWDTLGFRGTCGPGFTLRAEGDIDQVLPAPLSQIAATTMIPVAHVLWSSAWLGIANAAVDRAQRSMRASARTQPGITPPGATRLAELSAAHQQMTELVAGLARRYEASRDKRDALTSMEFAVAMNNLKVSASRMVVDIVGRALDICGLDAYRLDTPNSMGRLVRDAYGAALLVGNDRLLGDNAQMLLLGKER
jgi:acyl-CoA dehydrogenase